MPGNNSGVEWNTHECSGPIRPATPSSTGRNAGEISSIHSGTEVVKHDQCACPSYSSFCKWTGTK